MAEARLLLFHKRDEARRWQEALDAAGLKARCAVFDPPEKDSRGFWQPPRWLWHEIERGGRTLQVYMIDGDWYRDNIDTNFSGGANPMAYPEIEENAIYVEAANSEDQHDPKIIADHHEAPEYLEMVSDWQKNYEEAHGHAITEERKQREPHRDQQVMEDPNPESVVENAS